MRKLLYIWILLPLCIACERDLMSYEGEEAIYFAVQSGHSYASEKDWPYMPYNSWLNSVKFRKILWSLISK